MDNYNVFLALIKSKDKFAIAILVFIWELEVSKSPFVIWKGRVHL